MGEETNRCDYVPFGVLLYVTVKTVHEAGAGLRGLE
jgi:hypothetical protein